MSFVICVSKKQSFLGNALCNSYVSPPDQMYSLTRIWYSFPKYIDTCHVISVSRDTVNARKASCEMYAYLLSFQGHNIMAVEPLPLLPSKESCEYQGVSGGCKGGCKGTDNTSPLTRLFNVYNISQTTCTWICCSLFCSYQLITFHGIYGQISSISRTKFQYFNVSYLLLYLSFPNPLKPGVQSRMRK